MLGEVGVRAARGGGTDRAKAIIVGQDKIGPSLANAPQRGSEALSRTLAGPVLPKSAGEPCPRHRPVSQSKVRQHTLSSMGDPRLPPTDDEFEIPGQRQPGRPIAVSDAGRA
jgi:hypothetical protein